ncbi:cytochrome C biogenesis protein transmembrane region [Corynebacterium efficiens YS-314]|uniref:Putative cytochrome c-type biogenesis protein n=1 Tax=Corynebacterium efficiens (strain DSM 44549 / YS-314 / AJ 12310 / JCM 11189 / NBRC 100395) TaxID=196164 RepID=Q8FSS0_COREF|nr:cytochrome c biogenesis CcdA family protein [Corynebacterium efficiens]EEW50911.1 cytochrome C biogenesis protein transmembrane region [Corynebacterium efficiens YS-314]BAC17122.1 putative cytochrome c-type biogenesis protein [Corynebacterium efficiens YS-314]
MDIGLVSAFLGGVLALLSPCAALLLPAFFASSVGAGPRLLLHGVIFYAGLLILLIPLGLGAGLLGELFVTQRQTIIVVSSVILVLLGMVQIFGQGFDVSRLLPGGSTLRSRAGVSTGLGKSLVLGMTSSVAGFCAGPILGAVLTLAATSGNSVSAALILSAYGAGMVVPLMVIAALWSRMGQRGQRMLRGRVFTFLGRQWHTTPVLSGGLIIIVGVIFWTTNGLVGVPELIPAETQAWLQQTASLFGNPLIDIVAIIIAAAVILILWNRRQRHHRSTTRTAPERGWTIERTPR